jgi:hypothetical protein
MSSTSILCSLTIMMMNDDGSLGSLDLVDLTDLLDLDSRQRSKGSTRVLGEGTGKILQQKDF